MKKIYIAGPYTKGDVAINVRNAIKVGDNLLKVGFIPFIPHLTHFWHLLLPHEYEQWLAYDNEWLKSCDALVRLPGESNGADKEYALAKSLKIPVFTIGIFDKPFEIVERLLNYFGGSE